MANVKVFKGTEATGDALVAIINKALEYPRRGTVAAGGLQPAIPATWDGSGARPAGWTKHVTANWVASSLDAQVIIPDSLANDVSQPASQGRLSGPEIATLATAIAGRVTVDIETGGYSPKANAAAQAARQDNK